MDYLEIILMYAEYIDGRTNYYYFFEKNLVANFLLKDGRTVTLSIIITQYEKKYIRRVLT